MRHRKAWRANGFFRKIGRIQDGIRYGNRNRIGLYFVLVDLDGANDAVLDAQPGAHVEKLEAGFSGPLGLAVAVDRPARNQSAVANHHLRPANRIAAARRNPSPGR